MIVPSKSKWYLWHCSLFWCKASWGWRRQERRAQYPTELLASLPREESSPSYWLSFLYNVAQWNFRSWSIWCTTWKSLMHSCSLIKIQLFGIPKASRKATNKLGRQKKLNLNRGRKGPAHPQNLIQKSNFALYSCPSLPKACPDDAKCVLWKKSSISSS